MMFWLITLAWLTACVLAIRWALPRLDASEKELLHEEALGMNEDWDWLTKKEIKERERLFLSAPVPPILNQSERWQERARRAEALGFRDEDDDRGTAA